MASNWTIYRFGNRWLNENASIPDFGQCMCDFLRECCAYPYLKVVMTTREELLEDRFGQLLKMKDSQNFIHIPIWHSSDDFENRIFGRISKFFDVDIRRDTLTHDHISNTHRRYPFAALLL